MKAQESLPQLSKPRSSTKPRSTTSGPWTAPRLHLVELQTEPQAVAAAKRNQHRHFFTTRILPCAPCCRFLQAPYRQPVDRTPTRTTHLCTYSASQNAVHKYSHSLTRTRVTQVVCLGVKSSLSSQRRVSYVAALVTEHFHTISLTCLLTIFSLSVLQNRIKKPCEIHGGVAATPNLHLPQVIQSDDFES